MLIVRIEIERIWQQNRVIRELSRQRGHRVERRVRALKHYSSLITAKQFTDVPLYQLFCLLGL